jgi:hypothetical protein
MKTQKNYLKDLAKGDTVISTGVNFEIVESPINRGQKTSPKSPWVIKNNEKDVWVAKVKCLDKNENYDPQGTYHFQSNSKIKHFDKVI